MTKTQYNIASVIYRKSIIIINLFNSEEHKAIRMNNDTRSVAPLLRCGDSVTLDAKKVQWTSYIDPSRQFELDYDDDVPKCQPPALGDGIQWSNGRYVYWGLVVRISNRPVAIAHAVGIPTHTAICHHGAPEPEFNQAMPQLLHQLSLISTSKYLSMDPAKLLKDAYITQLNNLWEFDIDYMQQLLTDEPEDKAEWHKYLITSRNYHMGLRARVILALDAFETDTLSEAV